jgi:DNA-binding transcriptional LysR family regulator
MLDNLEALAALADCRTMRRAALKLHISQSAVSKRIASLEAQLKRKLIEPRGRMVELTPAALRFLEKARPLIGEIKELVLGEKSETGGRIELDLSVSVLISWGAMALAKVRKSLPGIELKVNAHHASIAVERVRSGETMLALVQGEATIAPDLMALPILRQQIVIVPSSLKKFAFPKKGSLEVISMEPDTEAWSFINRGLKQGSATWGVQIKIENTLQSFSAIAQMARAGFGNGLVPLGVAEALSIPRNKLVHFPEPQVEVPVSLIGRRSTLARPLVQQFHSRLLAVAKEGE